MAKICPIFGPTALNNNTMKCQEVECAWWCKTEGYPGKCVKIAEVEALANLRSAIVSLQKVEK